MAPYKYKIALLLPYFGKWPEWIDLFFLTLKRNPSIDFIFYTDCDTTVASAPNILFHKITFDEYIAKANKFLDFKFQPANAYKLCDLRPLYGLIHQEDLKGYDFYGWTDTDIFFGDIRSFYTDDILEKFDVLSTHSIRISGHLALFRNTHHNVEMYKKIYHWKEALQTTPFVGIDEHGITNAYTMTLFDKVLEKFKINLPKFITLPFKKIKRRRLYLVEQYTTPFTSIPWLDGSVNSQHPSVWYYENGKITNQRDGDRNFIYLHLMNFRASRYRHDGSKAPWEGVERVYFVEPDQLESKIVINQNGISPV